MSQDTRILNITRNFRLKRNQALRAIEQCACAWVEVNVSVRDLTIAESIQARNKQAAERELLDASELPDITFKPPIGAEAAYRQERRLAYDGRTIYAAYQKAQQAGEAFNADKFYTEAIQ